MLKIDRAFIQGMDTRSHLAIVSALTTLSSQLDLEIGTEELETRAQVDQVVALGCHLGQRYLLGRPVAEAAAGQLWVLSYLTNPPL